jgi:4'-phosphopantetheinyl transferase
MGQDLSAVHKHIDIWTIDLRRMADDAVLSADERTRAARLIMPDARRRFIAARAGLREILAQITGIDAAALTFGAGEHGKPHQTGIANAPHFNLAHSGDLALVAIADRPVGVDLEQVRPLANMAQMADMSFTDEERAALWSLDEPAQTAAFFRLWTRKEALMKAHGAGFRLAKMFSVPLAGEFEDPRTPSIPPVASLASVQIAGIWYQVQEIKIADDFAAAVAIETDSADNPLQIHHYSL